MSEQPKKDPNEDRLLDHNYDGIQEYDNPLPRWWVVLFWATIVFAVLYFLNVIPGLGTGRGRIANYEKEMQAAQAKFAIVREKQQQSALTDDAVLALTRDPAALAAGGQTFTSTCAPCHRPDGGGNIGPNLTDDYWLHGNKPTEIVHTITVGVPDKGMPTWGQALSPEQIARVAAYVLSLHGTHPPDPKAPQGVKLEETAPATPGK
jgi:cytochrome c oxidase cbb3-type subunit 3